MRIAMIGTRGVPARYGGFETAVEEVGSRLAAAGHEIVVFCRPADGEEPPPRTHRGMRLIQLPIVRKRSIETLAHTALSVIHPALNGVDAALVFNAANAPLLPLLRLRRIPVATHVDGLEWMRSKWGRLGRRYYRVAESLAVRWSDEIIADAQGIADYYQAEFGAHSRLIAYGAPDLSTTGADRLAELELAADGYHLVVARFEPENHVLPIVEGYVASDARLPLVVVGSAPYSDSYIAAVQRAADDRVRLLGGVWDQELLDQLYANAASYLHGHSVGGTNPSLLRAAGAAAPVIAFDTVFNREVVGEHALLFNDADSVSEQLHFAEAHPAELRVMGERLRESCRRYNWDSVATAYEQLCRDLAGHTPRPSGASGRRRKPGWKADAVSTPTVLVTHPSPELYGSDRVLLESISALVEDGCRVVLTLPETGPLVPEARSRGAEVEFCPTPILRKAALRPVGALRLMAQTLRSLPAGLSLLRRTGASTVVVNTLTTPLWLVLARLAGVRSVCHVHEAEASQSPAIRRLLYAPLLCAGRLIVNSRFSLETYAQLWPSLRRRSTVVYNGVTGPAEPASPPRTELAGGVRLLFIGRLSPRKGPDVAIDALAALVRNGVEASLDLLGTTFEGYEWFEQQLHDQVDSLGLGSRVSFLGFRPMIWDTLADVDIVLVPSTVDEPFGNTAVEAMLAERPLVVSQTSGLKEAAAGFETVRFVRPSDPDAIAEAVMDLVREWAGVRAQVAKDRERAIREFAPSRYHREFATVVTGGRNNA